MQFALHGETTLIEDAKPGPLSSSCQLSRDDTAEQNQARLITWKVMHDARQLSRGRRVITRFKAAERGFVFIAHLVPRRRLIVRQLQQRYRFLDANHRRRCNLSQIKSLTSYRIRRRLRNECSHTSMFGDALHTTSHVNDIPSGPYLNLMFDPVLPTRAIPVLMPIPNPNPSGVTSLHRLRSGSIWLSISQAAMQARSA